MAYTLTGRKIGTVRFTQNSAVGSESESMSSQVTSNPVENGSEMNDHHINAPTQFSISGVTVDTEAYQKLIEMRENHDLLEYLGRFRKSNLVITSLSGSASANNKGGYTFSASFAEVKIGTSELVETGAEPMMSANVKKTGNAGTKTTSIRNVNNAAYVDYVNSFNTGTIGVETPSISGVK